MFLANCLEPFCEKQGRYDKRAFHCLEFSKSTSKYGLGTGNLKHKRYSKYRKLPSGRRFPLVQNPINLRGLRVSISCIAMYQTQKKQMDFQLGILGKIFHILHSISLMNEIETVAGRRSNFGKWCGIRGGSLCSSLSVAISSEFH